MTSHPPYFFAMLEIQSKIVLGKAASTQSLALILAHFDSLNGPVLVGVPCLWG